MFKNPIIRITVCSLTIAAATGQETAAPATIDISARRQSVINMEAHIVQREARLAEMRQDIATLDGRIEKRVDGLVDLLAGIRDSADSRVRVSKMKQDVIEGLRRAIQNYSQKRRQVAERVRTGDAAALDDIAAFDKRIARRIEQIVELSKSFPTHTDTEKYESTGDSYWNGYYGESTRVRDEWKQNRRDSAQSTKQREEILTGIKDGLTRLDQRRATIMDTLANRNPTAAERELYQKELGQIDAFADQLNVQLVEVTMASGGATRALGLNEAHDVELMLADARTDLRQDVADLFQLYDQFDRGRAQINALKENLAARKEWLEKNAPKEN